MRSGEMDSFKFPSSGNITPSSSPSSAQQSFRRKKPSPLRLPQSPSPPPTNLNPSGFEPPGSRSSSHKHSGPPPIQPRRRPLPSASTNDDRRLGQEAASSDHPHHHTHHGTANNHPGHHHPILSSTPTTSSSSASSSAGAANPAHLSRSCPASDGPPMPLSISEPFGFQHLTHHAHVSRPSPLSPHDVSSPLTSPVSVDRSRLVGLGELATPRWATKPNFHPQPSTPSITPRIPSDHQRPLPAQPHSQPDHRRPVDWRSASLALPPDHPLHGLSSASPLAMRDQFRSIQRHHTDSHAGLTASSRSPLAQPLGHDREQSPTPPSKAGSTTLPQNTHSTPDSFRVMQKTDTTEIPQASSEISIDKVSHLVSQSVFMTKLAAQILPQSATNQPAIEHRLLEPHSTAPIRREQAGHRTLHSSLSITSDDLQHPSSPRTLACNDSSLAGPDLPLTRSPDLTEDSSPLHAQHAHPFVLTSPVTSSFTIFQGSSRQPVIANSSSSRAYSRDSKETSHESPGSQDSPLQTHSQHSPRLSHVMTSPSKPSLSSQQASRYSYNSPSTIAQSILKSASSGLVSKDLEVMDMEQAAAKNDCTAEALRKLDGLSTMPVSPKNLRHASRDHHHHHDNSAHSRGHSRPTSPGTSQHRRHTLSRPNSSSSNNGKDRALSRDRHKLEDSQSTSPRKNRTRSVGGTRESNPSSLVIQTDELYPADNSLAHQRQPSKNSSKPPPTPTLPSQLMPTSQAPLHSAASSFSGHLTGKGPDRSGSNSSSPKVVFSSTSTAGNRRASHGKSTIPDHAGVAQCPTSDNQAPLHNLKRGSSSSTSYTHTTLESRDSSLATSISPSVSTNYAHPQSNLPPTAHYSTNRSPTAKSRNSAGSESSSLFSGGIGEPGRQSDSSNPSSVHLDSGESLSIPPVPPLPKDYETLQKLTGHFNLISTQHSSPQFTQTQTSSPKISEHRKSPSVARKQFDMTESHETVVSSSRPNPILSNSSVPSTSATTRFLHSLTTHKTSEDSTGSITTTVHALASAPPIIGPSSKSSKKWSLSAALGINKTPSFTKDVAFQEAARASAAAHIGGSHHTSDARILSLGSNKDCSNETAGSARHTSWVPASLQSPNSPQCASHDSPDHHHAINHAEENPPLVRDRTESTSSIRTTDTQATTTTGSHHNNAKSSTLSSRRTPSGIPFFSRKSSLTHSSLVPDRLAVKPTTSSTSGPDSANIGAKIKSPKLAEKGDGESGGRKSMLALNVFIRNSVHRRPTLSSNSKSGQSATSSFASNETDRSPPTTATFSAPASHKPTTDQDSSSKFPHRKKLSIHEQSEDSEPTQAKKNMSLGSKASSLMSRRRGKTVSSGDLSKKNLPPPLPPLKMSAIHHTTVARVDTMNTGTPSGSGASLNVLKRRSGDYGAPQSASLAARGTRVRTLKESTTSVRKGLPTIDASPLRPEERTKVETSKLSTSANYSQRQAPQPMHDSPEHRLPDVSKENVNIHQTKRVDRTNPTVLSPILSSRQPSNHSVSITPTKIPRSMLITQKNSSPLLKSQPSDRQLSLKVDGDQDKDYLDSSLAEHEGLSPNDFGLLSSTHNRWPTANAITKRGSEVATEPIVSSLIPRTRSGGSIASRSAQKTSNNDLRSDANQTLTCEIVDDPVSKPSSQVDSNPTVSTESSAAARLAAARRTVAKTQESQAARAASRRLSGHHQSATIGGEHSYPSNVSEFGGTSGILSSSRSSRTISSKLALPSRISRSSTTASITNLSSPRHGSAEGTRGGYNSLTTQAVNLAENANGAVSRESIGNTSLISEEEIRGDEEMMQYMTRQRNKKLMSGMTPAEVDRLFEFPKPVEPTKPMTVKEALRLYKSYLSDYEKGEILEFEEIFYVGSESQKKMGVANPGEQLYNYGYDDERGDYQIVKNDHLMYRYEVIELLGKGSFGQVLKCRDYKTGLMVAIKIIRNKRRFHHQALVEIKVLENLLKWDPEDRHCVLKMTDHFSFRGHLCIVNELLSINLYELIRNNSFNGFSLKLIKRFNSQILASLSLLRHHRVVHCDLKPENILLRHPEKSAIKTIDFGSSCFENEKVYTYIQSRFYRSPEVILGMNYHMAIDMWSLGCILAELHTGYPIFPGETESEQLACIMEVLGMPDKYLIDRSSRRKLFFDSSGAPRPVVNSKGRRRRVGSKTLQSVLKTDDELFVDFIAKCLAWDPERRLKPDPAMRHPWMVSGRGRQAVNTLGNGGRSNSISNRLMVTNSLNNRSTTSNSGIGAVAGVGGASLTISSPKRKNLTASVTSSSISTMKNTNLVVSGTAAGTGYRVRTQSNSTLINPTTSSSAKIKTSTTFTGSVLSHELSKHSNNSASGTGTVRQSLPVRGGM